jgi:hypothetical protein
MAGPASVTVTQVVNGIPLTSNVALFTITPFSPQVAPFISFIRPFSVPEGSGGFTLAGNGSNFVPGATVRWAENGTTTLAASFVNSGRLLANVPSFLLTVGHAGTVSVTVSQVINGVSLTSNVALFTVTAVGGGARALLGGNHPLFVQTVEQGTLMVTPSKASAKPVQGGAAVPPATSHRVQDLYWLHLGGEGQVSDVNGWATELALVLEGIAVQPAV